jgi:carotenoid cleavage dioxygenase-like enzyme
LSFNGGLPEIQTVSVLRQSRQNFRNGFNAWFIGRMLTIFNDGRHVVKINYCLPPELDKGGFKTSKNDAFVRAAAHPQLDAACRENFVFNICFE